MVEASLAELGSAVHAQTGQSFCRSINGDRRQVAADQSCASLLRNPQARTARTTRQINKHLFRDEVQPLGERPQLREWEEADVRELLGIVRAGHLVPQIRLNAGLRPHAA